MLCPILERFKLHTALYKRVRDKERISDCICKECWRRYEEFRWVRVRMWTIWVQHDENWRRQSASAAIAVAATAVAAADESAEVSIYVVHPRRT